MKLGDRLKEIRQQHKMTLLEIAGNTKMSVSYLSDLERGRTRPSMDTLERLAGCYEITIFDLLANVDGWGLPSIEGLAPGLYTLVQNGAIDERAAQDLNRIEFRGKRPQTEDEWRELYYYLKRMMKPYLTKEDNSSAGG